MAEFWKKVFAEIALIPAQTITPSFHLVLLSLYVETELVSPLVTAAQGYTALPNPNNLDLEKLLCSVYNMVWGGGSILLIIWIAGVLGFNKLPLLNR